MADPATAKPGRAWLLGDDIDTDQLAPGRYMKAPLVEQAAHCLESVLPEFADRVANGDIIVAGNNFGAGSSREQAAQVLKHLGVRAVVARSFAGIFYRNAINLGLPALAGPAADLVDHQDPATIDLDSACLHLPEKDITIVLEPMPDFLIELVRAGGLVPHLRKRFSKSKPEDPAS